ncbi:MAG: hypothetical protein A2Z95_07270 [Gallionellales bacterium GWA2_60_18]|nr:MAG: hypothetical protein A2Z95_07270 [Gallionellales bacterium GWA2_60_18]
MNPFTSQQAAPGFDHPLELLHACHGKIMYQCGTLRKLAAHLASKGCDEQAQQAAQGILCYFDTAGGFHHQDEEEDLFPALRATGDAQAEALLQRLLREHEALAANWNEVRPLLAQIAEGTPSPLAEALTERLIMGYFNHIDLEEKELLPLATRLLDPQRLEQLGRRMAERRGAKFPPSAVA